MSAERIDTSKVAITGQVTLGAQLPNGRSISVISYIYDGEPQESINARWDLLQEAIERQRIRCEIPELEAKREQMIGGLKQLRQVLNDLEAKKREKGNLTSNEEMAVKNHATQIDRMSEEIDKGAAAIADAKKKAGLA